MKDKQDTYLNILVIPKKGTTNQRYTHATSINVSAVFGRVFITGYNEEYRDGVHAMYALDDVEQITVTLEKDSLKHL